MGVLLLGKAAAQGGQGAPMAVDPGSSALALHSSDNGIFDGRRPAGPSGAGEVFYAVGLVVIGLAMLVFVF